MKQILHFFLFLFIPFTALAEYHEFIDEDKQWVEKDVYSDMGGVHPGDITYSFVYFKGDSLIEGETYYKLLAQQFYYEINGNNEKDSVLKSPDLFALLREDIEEQKVFDHTGRLVYDFSLSVGDVFINNYGDNRVDSIVTQPNGRRKFYFNTGTWYVEGIGGSEGILHPLEMSPMSSMSYINIICYSENGHQLFGTCDYPEYILPDDNTYHMFIDEDKQWVEYYTEPQGFLGVPIYLDESSYSFVYFEGDSVYNGTTYKKLMKQQFYFSNYILVNGGPVLRTDSTIKEPIVYALLKENIVKQQVYNILGEIIYDFSLEKGDVYQYRGDDCKVDSVVVMDDGRRKFYFDLLMDHEKNYYIEGIGGANGLLNPLFIFLETYNQFEGEIICYTENEIQLYGTCEYPEFKEGVDATDDYQVSPIDVYPNPVKQVLNISSEQSISKVELYGLDGRLILISGTVPVDLRSVREGIYILSITLESGKRVDRKIVKR